MKEQVVSQQTHRVNDAPPIAARMANTLIPYRMVTHGNVFDVEKKVIKWRRKALFELYW